MDWQPFYMRLHTPAWHIIQNFLHRENVWPHFKWHSGGEQRSLVKVSWDRIEPLHKKFVQLFPLFFLCAWGILRSGKICLVCVCTRSFVVFGGLFVRKWTVWFRIHYATLLVLGEAKQQFKLFFRSRKLPVLSAQKMSCCIETRKRVTSCESAIHTLRKSSNFRDNNLVTLYILLRYCCFYIFHCCWWLEKKLLS